MKGILLDFISSTFLFIHCIHNCWRISSYFTVRWSFHKSLFSPCYYFLFSLQLRLYFSNNFGDPWSMNLSSPMFIYFLLCRSESYLLMCSGTSCITSPLDSVLVVFPTSSFGFGQKCFFAFEKPFFVPISLNILPFFFHTSCWWVELLPWPSWRQTEGCCVSGRTGVVCRCTEGIRPRDRGSQGIYKVWFLLFCFDISWAWTWKETMLKRNRQLEKIVFKSMKWVRHIFIKLLGKKISTYIIIRLSCDGIVSIVLYHLTPCRS